MDRLKNLIGISDIKIITGMRRFGKSEILQSLKNKLNKIDKIINIIDIDFANLEFDELKEYKIC